MTNDERDPIAIAAAIPPALLERLEAMGVTTAAALTAETDRAETAEQAAERHQRRQETLRGRWADQVPPMYAEAHLDDLDAPQAIAWPADSLHLVIAGPVGTGKTHAAYALGNAAVAAGKWVYATTVPDLLAALRPDGDRALAAGARNCQVLILDDLAASQATPWAQEAMTDFLDARVRGLRRTIVTTNATETDLEAAWGGRFVDRLRYRRTVKVMAGESRRKAAW